MSIFGVSHDGRVKVEWVDLGEGTCGDYNPDDPDDVALLRYDSYVRLEDDATNERRSLESTSDDPEWGLKDDGSYCTLTPAESDDETLKALAELIADQLADNLDNGGWKSTAERMSWAQPDWVLQKQP